MRNRPPSHLSIRSSSGLALVAAVQVLLALVLVLTACGGGSSTGTSGTSGPTATATFTATPTATPDPAAALALNAPNAATESGLHLGIMGITDGSPGQPYANVGIACSPNLAFAAPNPAGASYAASDLRAIRDYVNMVPITANGYPIPDGRSPSALRWLAAGYACAARLDVTNNGDSDTTISAVGLQLVASPASNTYHYAQVDLCSINARFEPCGFQGQGPDAGYVAAISVAGGGTGATFLGAVGPGEADDPAAPQHMFLAKGQSKSIIIRIRPQNVNAPGAIYRVVPQLTVSDSTTHVVTFGGLAQTLAFADPSQIACYGLAGSAVVPTSQITYASGTHSWC